MLENIILTTGIYDLIKDHIRRKKATKEEEEILITELKKAQQVLRKDLPADIVTVNRRVKLMDHSSQQEFDYHFVGPKKEKNKKGKHSILSTIGLATVGRKKGDIITWPFGEGKKTFEILNVEEITQSD